MTQLLLAFGVESCPVVARGECDCEYCREAWPEEYGQPRELKPVKRDGIVRGTRPRNWQADQERAAEVRKRIEELPVTQPAWTIY